MAPTLETVGGLFAQVERDFLPLESIIATVSSWRMHSGFVKVVTAKTCITVDRTWLDGNTTSIIATLVASGQVFTDAIISQCVGPRV
jgi:hypothetical protein